MKTKTHRKITRRILQKTDPKIVDRVNKMIDRPEPWMPTYSPKLGGMPGASHRRHRRKGHDLLTASIIGLLEGGLEGLAVAGSHLALDAARDQLVKKYGAGAADLVEDVINIVDDLDKKTKLKRKRRARAKVKNDAQGKLKRIAMSE